MDQAYFDYHHNLCARRKRLPPGCSVLSFTLREWKAFRFLRSYGLESYKTFQGYPFWCSRSWVKDGDRRIVAWFYRAVGWNLPVATSRINKSGEKHV